MKILSSTFSHRISTGAVRIAVLAGLSLALGSGAYAKKGGGKPGGGGSGGEDPPAEPPPFYYQVSWINGDTEEDNPNYFRLYDVATDGTAVGQYWPSNSWNDAYAVACFPDGDVCNLEALLIADGAIPGDTRVRSAYRISSGLLIALDVWDAAGFLNTGALQLNPDGTIAEFSLFSDPGGESAVTCDVSENGEFLIAATDINETPGQAGGLYFGNPATMFVWNPDAGTTVAIPGQVAGGSSGWIDSKISDYPATLLEGSFYEYTTGVTWTMPDPGTAVTPLELGADGTVVANVAGAQIRKNRWEPSVLARWSPGAAQWETVFTGGSDARINGSGEIAIVAGGDLSVFHDAFGLQTVDEMIDPAQAGNWDANAWITLRELSDPLPGDPYGGVILGMADGSSTGPHFVLIPVPAEIP